MIVSDLVQRYTQQSWDAHSATAALAYGHVVKRLQLIADLPVEEHQPALQEYAGMLDEEAALLRESAEREEDAAALRSVTYAEVYEAVATHLRGTASSA